jgi:hypothetical protein
MGVSGLGTLLATRLSAGADQRSGAPAIVLAILPDLLACRTNDKQGTDVEPATYDGL